MPEVEETDLYKEIERVKSDLIDKVGDYGYGGEIFYHHEIDTFKLIDWIEAREKRLLGGMTAEEMSHIL